MRLGDIANEAALPNGKPLDGVRVLAVEQMQALPFATQLLARLGADVVKVEHPVEGDLARSGHPFVRDASGRAVGATFLRNNLDKRSVGIDLKSAAGRQLVLRLAPRFDVFAENFKTGALARMGLGYDDVAAVHPSVVYVSVSGFGSRGSTRYDSWPAYAGIAEAMSGMYEFKRVGDAPPVVSPFGALGDTASALFAVIGLLAALRHRERTGLGQHVDVAMYDALVAMADIVPQYWSMGAADTGASLPMIMDGFRCADGWFVMQVGRPFQFQKLVEVIGRPEWLSDPALRTPPQWRERLEDVIRPGIEAWARDLSKHEACSRLAAAGVAAGPCHSASDVVHDPHLAARHMLVEVPRADGVDQPLLVPGNPVKLSGVAEGPEHDVPGLGAHTDEVLRADLGLDDAEIAALRADGIIG